MGGAGCLRSRRRRRSRAQPCDRLAIAHRRSGLPSRGLALHRRATSLRISRPGGALRVRLLRPGRDHRHGVCRGAARVAAGRPRRLRNRISRDRTLILLVLIVGAAFVVPIIMSVLGFAGVTVALAFFAIPIAAMPLRTAFATRSGPSLVAALKQMAAAEIAYALLLTLGLLI